MQDRTILLLNVNRKSYEIYRTVAIAVPLELTHDVVNCYLLMSLVCLPGHCFLAFRHVATMSNYYSAVYRS